MEFEKLFELALKGRSVNQAAKDWKVAQTTLNQYKNGRVPDYQTAMILSKESGVEPGEVMAILARLEARKKPRSLFPDLGYATAAIVLAVNFLVTPSPTEAAPLKKVATETLCIMSNLRRKLCQIMQAFFGATPPPAAA